MLLPGTYVSACQAIQFRLQRDTHPQANPWNLSPLTDELIAHHPSVQPAQHTVGKLTFFTRKTTAAHEYDTIAPCPTKNRGRAARRHQRQSPTWPAPKQPPTRSSKRSRNKKSFSWAKAAPANPACAASSLATISPATPADCESTPPPPFPSSLP